MERVQHTPSESQAIRQRIRRGEITGHTSGLAPGCVQGNVVILPPRHVRAGRNVPMYRTSIPTMLPRQFG